MNSFPSSWIIGTGSAGFTPPAPPRSPQTTPRPPAEQPATTTPPKLPSSPPPRTHQYHNGEDDAVHLAPAAVRAAYMPITMQTCCCCCDDIFPEHLRPPGSPSSSSYYRDLLSASKPMPQQSPFTSTSTGAAPPQYPTHFPSTWFLGAQSDGLPTVGFQHQHTRSCPHVHSAARRPPSGSPLRHVSPHPQTSTETCPPLSPPVLPPPQRSVPTPKHTHNEEGGPGGRRRRADSVAQRQQTNAQPHHLSGTMDVDDAIMRELKGAPSRQEEIDRWIQSLSHALPRSGGGPGSLHSGTSNNALWWARERHPSELSEVSDDSGLGDAPHKGLEVPDTYSVYTTSTYARSMAR